MRRLASLLASALSFLVTDGLKKSFGGLPAHPFGRLAGLGCARRVGVGLGFRSGAGRRRLLFLLLRLLARLRLLLFTGLLAVLRLLLFA